MKRIHEKHSNKDRIICVSIPGCQQFYYQKAGSSDRAYLFETDYSGSVFAFFRDKGRNLAGRGFSLTIKELYEVHDYHNVKLTHTLERIPVWIDYILKEDIRVPEQDAPAPVSVHTVTRACSDERAA